MKTSELIGAALDWAVAKCEFPYASSEDIQVWVQPLACDDAEDFKFQPSTNWEQGGPIIQRAELSSLKCYNHNEWGCLNGEVFCEGSTPLIAAMRCYVASKLGDEVELPTELDCI